VIVIEGSGWGKRERKETRRGEREEGKRRGGGGREGGREREIGKQFCRVG